MKNLLYILFITLMSTQFAFAQNWVVYSGDAAPADNVDPAWNASNGSEGTWTVQADPDNASNNVILYESLGADKGQYKTNDFDPVPTVATVVLRVKAGPTAADAVQELDLHINGFRDQLIVNTDNTLSLTRSGGTADLNGTLDVTEWNVFRITLDASSGTQADVKVYLNEEDTPVLTAVSTTTTTAKYIRFGDGQSSKTYSSYLDFFTWELSAASAPSVLPLPDGLLPKATSGNWVVYGADSAPADNADPKWNASNGSEGTWTVQADPDNAKNNIILYESLGADKGQYKTNDFDPVPTTATVALRIKSGPTAADAVQELDLHINGLRDQLIINSDNTLSLTRSGAAADLNGTLDVTEWNTFRITVDASSGTEAAIKIYLNEDDTPVLTATSTTTTSAKYIRFGDGQSSKTYSSYLDFLTWDLTGAYTPSALALPADLVPKVEIPVGKWTVYEADVLPGTADPVWSESNTKSNPYSWDVVADPDVTGNSLLKFASLEAGGGAMWKTVDFDPIPKSITAVFRAKLDGSVAERVLEMDMHINGFRDQLIVTADNEISLQRSDTTVAVSGLDVTQWNTFRITLDASNGTEGKVNVYLNEEATPVLTVSTTTTTSSKYIRFGDGNSTPTYASLIDFVAYDTTGAYAPNKAALPKDLIPTPDVGAWTLYEADVLPSAADPAWSESNTKTNPYSWDVVVDPDVTGNSLLKFASLEAGGGAMWKTIDFDPIPQGITAAFRTKLDGTDAERVLELDMHINGFRDQLIVTANNEISLQRSDTTISVSGLDVTQWNTFRITLDASSGTEGIVNVYLNENVKPVLSVSTTTTTSSKYIRFGDGNSTPTYASLIDFVAYDTTGAYSPAQRILPSGLIPGTEGEEETPTPSLKTLGSVGPLSQDLGLATDFNVESYKVAGFDLTAGITITPPASFEVSLNQTDWFTSLNPLVIAQTSGAVSDTAVYVKLNASAVGDFSGDITHSSAGAENKTVAVSGTVVNLLPELSLTGTLDAFTQNLSSPSAAQNYRVSGVNLKGSITVTAPTSFEVSSDMGSTWQSTVSLEPTDRKITNATVYVRLSESTLGDYSGTISHTATDATEVTLAVSGSVIPDPGINVTSEFTSFSQTVGTASAAQSYTVSGSNLANGISISLPEGFQISNSGDLWFSNITLAPLNGNVEATTLYIRMNASAEGTFSGDIVHSSNGVDPVSTAITGTTKPLTLNTKPKEINLSFYPNPSIDNVIFERSRSGYEGTVSIYSLRGTLIDTYTFKAGATTLEIDVTSVPKGLYLMEYLSEGEKVNQKFIKK